MFAFLIMLMVVFSHILPLTHVYLLYLYIICRWGILHTEKFWRENAKLVEQDNFKALRALIALLASRDPVSLLHLLFILYI